MKPNYLIQKAARQLLKEQVKPIELGELPFHLALYPNQDELIVEIRKRWKIRLDQPATHQAVYVKKLLVAVFSGKPVTAEIKIECCDEFQTKAKLRSMKLL
jgi:uncharacterized protein YeaC (DUF1315 family)